MKKPDLFSALAERRLIDAAPLAAQCRPRTLDDFLGQATVLGSDSALRKWIKNGQIPSMIIWGPPGSGKTSFARLLGEMPAYQFLELSASETGVAEFKKIFADIKAGVAGDHRRTLLFVDEVHRLSKLQQDALLKGVEEGLICFIGVTTENPQYSVNRALLSRTQVIKFVALPETDLLDILKRGLARSKTAAAFDEKTLLPSFHQVLQSAAGDARRALNLLEMILLADEAILKDPLAVEKFLKDLGAQSALLSLDDEIHYRYISDYIKAMRASNEEVAMDRLARLLACGEDPLFVARRLLIFAAEDVGLASPSFLDFAHSVYEAVAKVGMPEGRIHLAAGTLAACRTKKSREAIEKLSQAEQAIASGAARIPV